MTQTWYQRNKEVTKARAIEWAKNNTEKRRNIRIASRARHKVARNKRERHYLETHPSVLAQKRETTAKWKREHLENLRATESKRRTSKVLYGGSFTPEEWGALCAAYDFKCLCCGDKKPLEADHVIPVSKGGTSWISNIQPLCKSCNSSKGAKTIDYR
jgi:5-methylcytosine-specific restriction endonuclease McrA